MRAVYTGVAVVTVLLWAYLDGAVFLRNQATRIAVGTEKLIEFGSKLLHCELFYGLWHEIEHDLIYTSCILPCADVGSAGSEQFDALVRSHHRDKDFSRLDFAVIIGLAVTGLLLLPGGKVKSNVKLVCGQ